MYDRSFGLGLRLAIEEHMRARANKKGAVGSPDRIRDAVRGHAECATPKFRSDQMVQKPVSPPDLEFPTRIPPFIIVEISLSLLTYHFYVMTKPDREDGLIIRSRRPIEVIDGLRCAAVVS